MKKEGFNYLEKRDFDKAIYYLTKAIKLDPKHE